jgi:hypothetical protein
MGKSIHFFGQSVFGQLISLIDQSDARKASDLCQSDRFYKRFSSWDHLVSMLFCTFGNCQSLREVCGAFLGLKGKTEHFYMKSIPKRSTMSDANRNRTTVYFKTIYHQLLDRYVKDISDSRMKELYKKNVFIFDSSTIGLFQDILKCVGRNPVSGRSKGGIKVHTLLNADEKVPQLIWYSDAATHDTRFLSKINFVPGSIYLFDKGYTDYWLFDHWTKTGVQFCTRLRDNATYQSIEEIDIPDEIDPGVIKDEWIILPLRKNGKILDYTKLRRVAYWDDAQKRLVVCLTNIIDLNGEQIAALYKNRWQIESLYKQLKQNFPLKYFLGDNENAITIQIWCTLITNLLLTVVKEKLKRPWSFSNIVSFTRLHLFNNIHLLRFLEHPEKDWQKEITTQQNLFFSG